MKIRKDVEIDFGTVPEKEKEVAWIWFGDEQWAELSQEDGKLKWEFSTFSKKTYTFDYEEIFEILKKAKTRLLGEE